MAKVISIINIKGGVGKTTLTIELASALHETVVNDKHPRVLVIDLDENNSLSSSVGANVNTPNTIYEVMNIKCPITAAIQHLDMFDIIVGSKSLSLVPDEFCKNENDDDQYIMNVICHTVLDNEYDYILIDNAPSTSLLLTMTYLACDYVLVPSLYGSQSIANAEETIKNIIDLRENKKVTNARVIGIIYNQKEYNALSDAAEIRLAQFSGKYDVPLYSLPKTVKVAEMPLFKASLSTKKKGQAFSRKIYEICDNLNELTFGKQEE